MVEGGEGLSKNVDHHGWPTTKDKKKTLAKKGITRSLKWQTITISLIIRPHVSLEFLPECLKAKTKLQKR